MKSKRRIEAILFGILIPILLLVWFYGERFKRLPEWSREAYPWVLWTLVGITIVVAVLYVGLLVSDTWLHRGPSNDHSRPDDVA
jgi:hypothetical protein